MAYSVTNLKAELAGILHGTTLNQITNLDGLIYRAARKLLLDVDPQETKRISLFANAIYNSVYDYSLPTDVKGGKLVDIRPQVNRTNQDFFTNMYGRDFDIFKGVATNDSFYVQFDSGIKTVRINAPTLPPGDTINTSDYISGNGTWSVDGDLINLQEDTVNFASGNASLTATTKAGGTVGYFENSTMSPIDLTDNYNQGKVFVYVYLPDASLFTTINLRWGNDNTHYYTTSVSSDMNGNAFVNGWNLLMFGYGASVGTVDITKIGYLRVTFNFSTITSLTDVKIDNIVARKGQILECVYYSNRLFSDAITGGWTETITDDSNIINLAMESYNLLLDLVALYSAQQQQGYSATQFDAKFWQDKYNDDLTWYRGQVKSEYQKPQSTYYKKPSNNYNKWATSRFMR